MKFFSKSIPVILMLVSLTNCQLADQTPREKPPANSKFGDTWIRPADGMVTIYVPGGEFQMGRSNLELDYAVQLCLEIVNETNFFCKRSQFEDELPAHVVSLDIYWIDKTEVTNGQYRECVKAWECGPPKDPGSYTRNRASYYRNSAYDDYPVIEINWVNAEKYCEWVGGRVLSEAEWEYAARGPDGLIFPWGNEFDGTRLNFCDVNCPFEWADETVNDGFEDTAPVGSYPNGASWCGVMDMSGNVQEWVADWYGIYPFRPQINPIGDYEDNELHVVRGGTWSGLSKNTRSASRNYGSPETHHFTKGFRCAMDAE